MKKAEPLSSGAGRRRLQTLSSPSGAGRRRLQGHHELVVHGTVDAAVVDDAESGGRAWADSHGVGRPSANAGDQEREVDHPLSARVAVYGSSNGWRTVSCNGAPQPCNWLPVARNRRDGCKNGPRNPLSRADTDERHTRTGTVTFRRFDRARRARPRMRARPSQRAPTFPPWPGTWPLRLGPVGPAAVALAAPPPPSRARARAPVRSVICTISAAAARWRGSA